MVKSKNGPRSNFSLLPFEIQYKVIAMLQDGATFAAISTDPEIAGAYRKRGLKLAPPGISRLRKSRAVPGMVGAAAERTQQHHVRPADHSNAAGE